MTAEDAMRLILALDPGASVMFSQTTGEWYVSADVGISNGSIITGVCEHRRKFEDAVYDYLERLMEITTDHFEDHLTAKPYGEVRHYRWNGAAFAEIPVQKPAGVAAS